MTAATVPTTKVVGLVRVSSSRNREETMVSDVVQRQRLEDECERNGWKLVDVHDEVDVSGSTALKKRKGLRTAVEQIEAGQASILLAPYFDRLCRSLKVQEEVTTRVEDAGGDVFAIDFGKITNGSSVTKLSSKVIGAINEYYGNSVAERIGATQAAAVARGVPPWAERPVGYVMTNGQPLRPHPLEAPIVAQGFELRANGGSINDVLRLLRDNGIERSRSNVADMLHNRLYLGELHFGKIVKDGQVVGYKLSNLSAHEPIVNTDVWRRAQRTSAPRGRQPKSEFLLARTTVLRCGSCGGTMGPVTQHTNKGPVPHYKCSKSAGPCPRQVSIQADLVEPLVIARVKAKVGEIEGSAGIEREVRAAEAERERAHQALKNTIAAFEGFEDIDEARARLAELKESFEQADERVQELTHMSSLLRITAGKDWSALSLAGRRALIKRVIERITVKPGRGAGRVTIKTLAQ